VRRRPRNDMNLSLSAIFPRKDFVYACARHVHTLKFVRRALAERVVIVPTMRALHLPLSALSKYKYKHLSSGVLSLLGLPVHHSQIASFQTPATPIMEGIVDLHNDIMFFLTFIIVFVFYLLAVCVIQFSQSDNLRVYGHAGDAVTHNTAIEVI